MSDPRVQAGRLTQALSLETPAIAIAFADDVPAGVPAFDGTVPAGCRFWELAAKRVFATSAADHALCSIGVHTHGIADAPASQSEELQASLQAMMGLDYVTEEEVAAIPVMREPAKYVLYGPLAGLPVPAQIVLLFCDSRQGLVLAEAIERVDADTAPAMGRPACAAIPQVLNQGRAALSLGCCGARAYLDDLSDDTALWALPANKLDSYCDQIERFSGANKMLSVFHSKRREDVESGERPTVAESLDRLG
ncbi:MAG: DUF169 domain-containing protein [bacterium]|nr:DUF169 domain-containing protein [bacterium]